MINLTSPRSKHKLIQYYIDPDDTNIYRWQISNQNPFYMKLMYFVLFFFWMYYFIHGATWGIFKLISLLSENVAIAIALMILVLGGITVTVIYLEIMKVTSKGFIISIFLMMSSGIFFFLFSMPDSPFQSGFTTQTSFQANEWLRFFIQHGLNVLLIDIPDTFGIQLSGIQPVDWQGRFFTVMIKFFVSAGFLQTIANLYLTIFKSKYFYGTVRDTIKECINSLDNFGFGANETGDLAYTLIRKKSREKEQDILMVPKDFLQYMKSTKKFDDLFDL